MKHLIVIIFLFAIKINLVAQEAYINGYIYDELNQPLVGASICQEKTTNCVITDINGKFRITLINNYPKIITISFLGYEEREVIITDTIKLPIIVLMQIDTPHWSSDPMTFRTKLSAFVLISEVNRINGEFDSYSELIPQYRNMLNKLDYNLIMLPAGYYRNIYGAFGLGENQCLSIEKNDSMQTETSAIYFCFRFGYAFPTNNLKLVFTPFVSIDLLRYRLLTCDKNKKIPLSTYLQSKYYDLKFFQWFGTLGGNLDFRIYSKQDKYLIESIYFSIGAGYYFKLSKKPLIKVSGNDLTSFGKINYDNLLLQASIKLYIYE